MNIFKTALFSGLIATLIGFFTFLLSWNLFDVIGGPLPGYNILLFPANLTLIYFWHPLFTEEIALLPKLAMMLVGQFVIVSGVAATSVSLLSKVFNGRPK